MEKMICFRIHLLHSQAFAFVENIYRSCHHVMLYDIFENVIHYKFGFPVNDSRYANFWHCQAVKRLWCIHKYGRKMNGAERGCGFWMHIPGRERQYKHTISLWFDSMKPSTSKIAPFGCIIEKLPNNSCVFWPSFYETSFVVSSLFIYSFFFVHVHFIECDRSCLNMFVIALHNMMKISMSK